MVLLRREQQPAPPAEDHHDEAAPDETEAADHGRRRSIFHWCANCCSHRVRMYNFNKLIHSKAWRTLLVICTIILLFGAQIRTFFFFDRRVDVGFDALFCVLLGIFAVDLVMRLDVEPNYCNFNLGCRRDSSGAELVQFPSFLFFCELASMLAILHEISFIHQSAFDEMSISIQLDALGIPKSGLDDINEASPAEIADLDFIFTIAKTARVARFIRSTSAIKLSSKVNWYWFHNLFNPFWYFEKLADQRNKKGDSGDASSTAPAGSGSDLALTEGDNNNNNNSNNNGNRPTNHLLRNDWGGVGLGVLAAVQAQARAKEMAAAKERFRPVKRLLRKIGILQRNDTEWRRILAATKIQRAWRRAYYHAEESNEFSTSDDFASSARGRHNSGTTLDKFRLRAHSSESHHRNSSARHHHHHHHHHGSISRSKNLSRSRLDIHGMPMGKKKSRSESQVGSAMRELTGQRVACGIMMALLLTVVFTYTESDATRPATMIVLHTQTSNETYATRALETARRTSVPDMFEYVFANGTSVAFSPKDSETSSMLRDKERLRVRIGDFEGDVTLGYFSFREEAKQQALVSAFATVCMILVWFFGVTAFSGPVMVLVVIPIERMVRLLGMLTLDPLGYQSTSRYRKFVAEEDEITKNTRLTKEIFPVLKLRSSCLPFCGLDP